MWHGKMADWVTIDPCLTRHLRSLDPMIIEASAYEFLLAISPNTGILVGVKLISWVNK